MRIKELYVFEGMGKKKTEEVFAGDICAVVGLDDFNIGDTIADIDNPEALPVEQVTQQIERLSNKPNRTPGETNLLRQLRDEVKKRSTK
jgi:GTP-binding protein